MFFLRTPIFGTRTFRQHPLVDPVISPAVPSMRMS
jgi:hypothetical protein